MMDSDKENAGHNFFFSSVLNPSNLPLYSFASFIYTFDNLQILNPQFVW